MEGDKLKKGISGRPTGVFYLERNRAYFYEESLASPLSLELSADIISDLELVSKKSLETAIQAFVSANKLAPKNIVILLSTTVTFDTEFADNTLEIDKKIEEFLELVPFENNVSKQTKFPGKIKIVAANKELGEAIKETFVGLGFVVGGIYPLSFCLEVIPQLQTNLDLGLVINKIQEIRHFNLLSDVQSLVVSPKKEKKDNRRLYILAGVFAILMVILLFVIYRFIVLPPKQPSALPVSTPAPQPTIFEEQASPSAQFQTEGSLSTPAGNTQNF
ncbi:MAG: hypothetical protein HYW63_01385 [Candidatus Levybacteria bacterium]|nr:hypothetical protein [Candidatus Levybacteria bacterium]